MSLTIFNGSPRGKNSNSQILSQWFCDGYGGNPKTYYLNQPKNIAANVQLFCQSDCILMVFPLYVDGMPGQIKGFLEALAPHKDLISGKKITFIIHSGFTEGIQNRALERYLNRLVEIFSFDCRGIILVPGSEGFRLMPPAMTKKKHEAIASLAQSFKSSQTYPKALLKIVNPNETLSKISQNIFRVMAKFGLTNMYWNSNLKKNNAYDKRFDAPYAKGPVEATSKSYVKNY